MNADDARKYSVAGVKNRRAECVCRAHRRIVHATTAGNHKVYYLHIEFFDRTCRRTFINEVKAQGFKVRKCFFVYDFVVSW